MGNTKKTGKRKPDRGKWQRLFLESQDQGKRLLSQIIHLRGALVTIEEWKAETFPRVESHGALVSYGVAFGSSGERDYMRAIAREALNREALIANRKSKSENGGSATRGS